MIKKESSNVLRQKRHLRIRNHLQGTPTRPRLSVYRSNKAMYVQVIDDVHGKTLISARSQELGLHGNNKEVAQKLGELIAKKALEAGITQVVFDRSGYLYHGRVKELAEAARKAGLDF
ncbi:MAG TPA: 50S ribosomal protein L18 [Acholeplasmataceae bacterium]|jgi:large subunit ribosomal protein L18|nr:50S ribosomal protein L18 [Acholeplasmataceae bacterium]HQC30734.1 50S ribosomal protein L18 [Acholeplasmataceae bacterium]